MNQPKSLSLRVGRIEPTIFPSRAYETWVKENSKQIQSACVKHFYSCTKEGFKRPEKLPSKCHQTWTFIPHWLWEGNILYLNTKPHTSMVSKLKGFWQEVAHGLVDHAHMRISKCPNFGIGWWEEAKGHANQEDLMADPMKINGGVKFWDYQWLSLYRGCEVPKVLTLATWQPNDGT